MCADVNCEHVGPRHWCSEHTRLGVHATTQVRLGASECQIFLTTTVIVFCSEGVKVDGKRLRHKVPQQRMFLQHPVTQVLESISSSLEMICQFLSKFINPFVRVVVVSINIALNINLIEMNNGFTVK